MRQYHQIDAAAGQRQGAAVGNEVAGRIDAKVGMQRDAALAQQIELRRDITFNDSETLAKESEEALLYRDMQTDAVQQIIRRVSVIRSAAN